MMITAALIREQGITFGVIAVQPRVLSSKLEADAMIIAASQNVFPGQPIALMANRYGKPTYYGRPDIARFLASIDVRQIPWRQWYIN